MRFKRLITFFLTTKSFNIVKFIEKNANSRLTKNYNNELLKKIQINFSEEEQQMFVTSLYCYLKYSNNEFIINFDDIWKWVGFTRKGNAKKLLEKYFVVDVDYQIIVKNNNTNEDFSLCSINENSFSPNGEKLFSNSFTPSENKNEDDLKDDLKDESKNGRPKFKVIISIIKL